MTLTQETYGELQEIAARYPESRSGLLPMLHLVQSVEGRITPEGIEACADLLGLSAADVSGVATFYTMYKRKPVGDYLVGVCTNTLCAVMGGDEIFARLKDHLDVGNDETTADGKVTLEHIECNAACDYAPVVMVNWEFMDNQTPRSAVQLVDDLRAGTEVTSTRGPRLCTWREAERVLDREVITDAEIVLGELAANAVQHGRPIDGADFDVSWCVVSGLLRITVADGGEAPSLAPTAFDPETLRGRGLQMVDSICDRWRADRDRGTRITAELHL